VTEAIYRIAEKKEMDPMEVIEMILQRTKESQPKQN
jgi:hypothetical protein